MSKNGGIDIPIWLIIILLCTATPIGVVAIIAKIFLENGGQKLLKEKLSPPKLNTPPPKPPQRADAPQYPGSYRPSGSTSPETLRRSASPQYPGSYRPATAAPQRKAPDMPSHMTPGRDSVPKAPAKAPQTNSLTRSQSGKKLPSTAGATALTTLSIISLSVCGILTIVAGGIFLGGGGLNMALVATDCGFAIPGFIMMLLGMSRRKRTTLMRRLIQLIGANKQVPLARLSALTGMDPDIIEQSLERLINQGYFTEAYIDRENQLFVIGNPFEQDAQARKNAQTLRTASAQKEDLTAPAQQIRAINDRIAHPQVSQKMYRLEELTEKIYSYVERRPARREKLKSFEEYYLPNTLKILEAYANFEQQGIDGDNINATMADIEEVLDTLIAGFEKTLDNLFADEAMDISTDITVLENMLSRDGIGGGAFDALRKSGTP